MATEKRSRGEPSDRAHGRQALRAQTSTAAWKYRMHDRYAATRVPPLIHGEPSDSMNDGKTNPRGRTWRLRSSMHHASRNLLRRPLQASIAETPLNHAPNTTPAPIHRQGAVVRAEWKLAQILISTPQMRSGQRSNMRCISLMQLNIRMRI